MRAKIITIKRTNDLNYFSLCALNLLNLLRCTCVYIYIYIYSVISYIIYIYIYIYVTDVYARGVNVNLTPLTSNRGALATDARGCSLWRYLLERSPPTWESRVRYPLGTRYEFGLCGPGRGCYIYICVCNFFFIITHVYVCVYILVLIYNFLAKHSMYLNASSHITLKPKTGSH